jgi:hypothetical protein
MKRLLIELVVFLSVADTVVLIKDGEARVKRGKANAMLLQRLEDLPRDEGIDTACICAGTGADGFRLSLTGVPRSLHQRFRNVWAANWK